MTKLDVLHLKAIARAHRGIARAANQLTHRDLDAAEAAFWERKLSHWQGQLAYWQSPLTFR